MKYNEVQVGPPSHFGAGALALLGEAESGGVFSAWRRNNCRKDLVTACRGLYNITIPLFIYI